jgi:hypothetical protein
MHFNKKSEVTNAMLRVSDSIAYVAAARHVYVVMDDTEVEGRRLFAKAKNNLAPPGERTLSYVVKARVVEWDKETGEEIKAPYVVWGGEYVKISANEAMEAEACGGRAERREAKEWLRERLAAGPVEQKGLEAEAVACGIAMKTLRRAKKDLGVVSAKGKGLDGAWCWELP